MNGARVIDQNETTAAELVRGLADPGTPDHFAPAAIERAVDGLATARLLALDGDLIRPTRAAVLYSEIVRFVETKAD